MVPVMTSSSYTPIIHTSPYPTLTYPTTDLLSYLLSNPSSIPSTQPIYIDATTNKTLTHSNVIDLSRRLATGLRTKLHVREHDIVAVFSPNTIYYPITIFGILGCGATPSPVNAASTVQELRSQLQTSGAKLLIVHSSLLQVVKAAVEGLGDVNVVLADDVSTPWGERTLEEMMSMAEAEPLVHVTAEEAKTRLALMCFSSGTTGKSKGVMSSHYNIVSQLIQWKEQLGKDWGGVGDTLIDFLPMSHIYAMTGFVLGGMAYGHTVIVMQRFEMGAYLKLIEKWRPRTLVAVPPVVLGLAKSPLVGEHDTSSVTALLSAAAPLGRELAAECESRLKAENEREVNVLQAWGMTECSPMVSCLLSEHAKVGRRQGVGRLTPDVQARVVDSETGVDLVDRKRAGELWVRGPNVMEGYYGNGASTQESFVNDQDGGQRWYRTGDVGTIDEDGYLTIVDRIKEMIKYKGFQVIPSELEGKLLEHDYVGDACIVGVYVEQQATEVPAGFVTLKSKDVDAERAVAEVREWLESRIAGHKKLRGGLWAIDVVPKSASGKILRRELRRQYEERVRQYVQRQAGPRL